MTNKPGHRGQDFELGGCKLSKSDKLQICLARRLLDKIDFCDPFALIEIYEQILGPCKELELLEDELRGGTELAHKPIKVGDICEVCLRESMEWKICKILEDHTDRGQDGRYSVQVMSFVVNSGKPNEYLNLGWYYHPRVKHVRHIDY